LNSKTRKQRETNYILEKKFDAIRIGLSKKEKEKKNGRSHERFKIRGNAHQDAEKRERGDQSSWERISFRFRKGVQRPHL
jgi:hypothetical protein